jgi:hypothetical protein
MPNSESDCGVRTFRWNVLFLLQGWTASTHSASKFLNFWKKAPLPTLNRPSAPSCTKTDRHCVRFEVLKVVTTKNDVWWDIKIQFVPHRWHYVSATEPNQLTLCKMWGIHGGDYEECRLLGYKNPVRLLVTANIVPSSPILVTQMMMDAIRSSETSVLTRATRLNIPEDGMLHGQALSSCLQTLEGPEPLSWPPTCGVSPNLMSSCIRHSISRLIPLSSARS